MAVFVPGDSLSLKLTLSGCNVTADSFLLISICMMYLFHRLIHLYLYTSDGYLVGSVLIGLGL